MSVVVKSCGCVSEFQDKIYGRGKRVKNITKSGRARCTVCKLEESLSSDEIKKVKGDTNEKKSKKMT